MMQPKPEKQILSVRWSLLAVLLLGTALRFLNLGRQSLWCDEAWSWLVSQMGFIGIIHLGDNHPPLYYFLLKISLWILPSSEFGLRLISCIFSIAAMTVMVRFVNRRWGHRAAVYVGLLVALSPSDIYYAQEARMYSLLAFLFVLAFTELVEALEGKPAHLIGWVVANVGLAWTHAYGLLTVSLQVGFVLGYWAWQRLRGRPLAVKSRPLLGAITVVFLACIPIIVLFWMMRIHKASGAGIPTIHNLIDIVRWWTTGPMFAFPAFHLPWRMYDVSAVAMVGCAGLGVRQLWKRDEFHRWILYFAVALIVLPAAVIFAYSILTKHALWVDRGFVGNGYILYLLAGVGLSALGSRVLRAIAAVAIGVSIASGEIYYYTTFEKSDPFEKDSSAAAFHSLPPASPQRVLLLAPGWSDDEALYYLGRQTPVLSIEPDHPEQLLQIGWVDGQMPQEIAIRCDDPQLQSVTEIYVYGDPVTIRSEREQWPLCILDKKMWIFEGPHWHPLDK
jgi:hypothetical protein